MSEDKRQQVVAQCRAVAHLATALAQIHVDYEKLLLPGSATPVIDVVGARSAAFMEALGDMLNSMDAVADGDEWLFPIFVEAQRLWPAAAPPGGKT